MVEVISKALEEWRTIMEKSQWRAVVERTRKVRVDIEMTYADRQLLRKIAESRRTSLSATVRHPVMLGLAHLNYLSQEGKKALGL